MQPETKQQHPAAGQLRRQAWGLLISTAQPEIKHIWLGAALLLAAALLEAAGPLLGKYFIDNTLLTRQLDWPEVCLLLSGYLITGWAATWLRYLQLLRLADVAMSSVKRLRQQVYQHVLSLPMAYFDKAITGQLVSRVTNDTEAVKNLYIQVLFVMLDSSIVVFGALVAMAWLDWRLMLIVLTLLPTVVLIVWFYQRWSAPAVAKARQLRSDLNAQLAEAIQGMSSLQAVNAQASYASQFAQTNQAHLQARLDELRANAWLLRPALDLMNCILLIMVIYSFGQASFSGLEIGILYAFISYIARVVEPLIQITLQFGQIQQAVTASARVSQLLQEPIESSAHQAISIKNGDLKVENVSFSYTPGRAVLHKIDLEFAAGQFYGIVGHTGSGKSTLLSLLLRFYPLEQGQIWLDQRALHDYPEAEFRFKVGLVPQDPFLIAGSVAENIAMGRPLSAAEIETAARAAHIHDAIMGMPEGYQTRLGEAGARLSTGQKQLIAIARALAVQPAVLLLDEATSHIDSETEQVVQQTLHELRGKVTVIAIAHRLSTIREADQIIVLNHGHISERGRHEELMALADGIYQKLYWLQSLEEQQ